MENKNEDVNNETKPDKLKRKSRNNLPKPCLTRLARKAGVKSISDDSFEHIRNVVIDRITDVLKTVIIVNSESETKTFMTSDLYDALSILGENLCKSTDLGSKNILKK
jgi:histone H3/H4